MDKIFVTEFELDAKKLALIYICYQYKFPLCFMLSFYEMWSDSSLFALKALTCTKKSKLTDTSLMKALDESSSLYKQILKGTNTIRRIKETKDKINKINQKSSAEPLPEIPEYPKLTLHNFSPSFKKFVTDYLLVNVEDIYSPVIKLRFSSDDVYKEMMP